MITGSPLDGYQHIFSDVGLKTGRRSDETPSAKSCNDKPFIHRALFQKNENDRFSSPFPQRSCAKSSPLASCAHISNICRFSFVERLILQTRSIPSLRHSLPKPITDRDSLPSLSHTSLRVYSDFGHGWDCSNSEIWR